MPSRVSPVRSPSMQEAHPVSRPAADDEHYVMWRYASHATRCSQCKHPLETWRQGERLCKRGTLHAQSVTQYLRSRNGKVFSLVDRDRGRDLQVRVPTECTVIRELMLSLERGLLLEDSKPAKKDVIVRNENRELSQYPDKKAQKDAFWDRIYADEIVASKKYPKGVHRHSERGTLYLSDVGYTEVEEPSRSDDERLRNPPRRVTWADE